MDSTLFAATALLVSALGEDGKADPPGGLSPEKESYRWFDALGFPDLKGPAFVKVSTGWWSQSQGAEPENSHLRGFLIEDKKGKFTVLTEDLAIIMFERSPGDAKPHERGRAPRSAPGEERNRAGLPGRFS